MIGRDDLKNGITYGWLSVPVVARYKMKPNLFLTKSLGFLWSFGFSGHFKLLIKVVGNILGLVIRS